ncbi:autotransporter outer membrane beta-barrel domain-containing protein [Pseudomonas silvicola]|nr:autotransporter outer membrane beta-barrel domain-containing protein [Pseudomonas silvicola]
MTLLRCRLNCLAVGHAVLAVVVSASAAEYDQIDLSSTTGESLTLNGDHVTHTGNGATINVSGQQNQLLGAGLDVRANAASNTDAVMAVQATDGGKAALEHSTLIATGYFGDGASASGTGSSLRLEDTTIITNGSRGRGVVVAGGATAQLAGGGVSTTGMMADGLSAMGAGSMITTTGGTVSSTGNVAYAVRAQDGAQVQLQDTTAITYGQYAPVFGMTGADTVIRADGMTVESQKAEGVDMQEGLFVFSNGSLKAKGDGILIRPTGLKPGGQANISHSRIASQAGSGVNLNAKESVLKMDNTQVTTQGDYGSAIWMPGSGTRAEVQDSDLDTWGRQAAAVDNRAGTFSMTGGRLTTHGDSAHGLYASTDVVGNQDPGDDPRATFEVRHVTVETFGRGAMAAVARLPGAQITLDDSQVLTHGDQGHGLFASGTGATIQATRTGVVTQGASAYGLSISNDASVSLQGSSIHTQGAKAYGIVSQATDDGITNHLDLTDSVVATRNSSAVRVSGGSLAANLTNSRLTGSTEGEAGTALWVTDAANGVAAGQVVLDNTASQVEGDIQVDGGALQLNLRDGSTLDGAVLDSQHASGLDIDATSQWHVRGDSTLAALKNDGAVAFAAPATGTFMTLSVAGDLAGDGYYAMNTDLGEQRGDRIEVAGQITGSNRVLVHNSGAEPTARGQRLTLVQSQGGAGSFSLANRDALVDAGTYRYALRKQEGDAGVSWNLVNVGQTLPDPAPTEPTEPSEPAVPPEPLPPPVAPTPPVAPESVVPAEPGESPDPSPPPVPPAPPEPGAANLSTAASAAINSSALATLRDTWDAERGTLMQRLGDVRKGAARQGVWVRSYGQKQRLDNGVGRDFSQHITGIQLGADTRVATAGGAWVLGALLGHSQTDRRFIDEGSGKMDSAYAGTYATYLDDSGWYADSLLTLNRWSTRLDVRASDGAKVTGHSRSHGAGLSLETGKRLTLAHDWFIEPQVQFSALYAGGDRYALSNDLHVDASSGVATQLRAGTVIGHQPRGDAGLQPYLAFGWTQDLTARNRIRTNTVDSHPDGNGGGWYAGAGLTGSLGAGHQVYADIETSDSPALKRPWAVNAGYRYQW